MNGQQREPDTQRSWNTRPGQRGARLAEAQAVSGGARVIAPEKAAALLTRLLRPGDRVCLEGDNQKHAAFLARTLASLDPARVNNLHMVQSTLALPEHLEVFRRGIARRLDFSFSGPQAKPLAELVGSGQVQLGAIHTYLELFARYFLDLSPHLALVGAEAADEQGNLYTGANTEDTPTIIEATHFRYGIVVAQVNRIEKKLPRVDIPGDWVDFIIPAGEPCHLEPLFTRDPARITERQILMSMIALKGIYQSFRPARLTHGIGFNTAAIELLLPTYGRELGLKGQVATHWALNPHPTLIPAIESGFVEQVYSFGSEVGMEDYVRARPDIFALGADGSLRSNRMICQAVGHYAIDMFVGATLQMDFQGNSSTATRDRIAGFGGAPNMGVNAGGRRHYSDAWSLAGRDCHQHSLFSNGLGRGRKLVVQLLETTHRGRPNFVENLDACALAARTGMPLPPVMIYGTDVTHVISERGLVQLYRARGPAERMLALQAVAGRGISRKEEKLLRQAEIFLQPADLGIDPARANRELLAADSMADLVRWSGGLYQPPAAAEKG